MTCEAIGIRDAVLEDAEALSDLLIASITGLCRAYHGDDPKLIAKWIANKTPENIAAWIEKGHTILLVAGSPQFVFAGVGAAFPEGRIVLNYVHPDARFRGVSRTLLAALETRLSELGNKSATLTATTTAREFYLANGWEVCGPEENDYGFPGHRMLKRLTQRQSRG
ncbi:MAG: GNAT family N-acetyltransferase [Pseudomonadota bacterium]